MSGAVPADQIEQIVGIRRHRQAHFGRAVSAEQAVHILHSQRCLDSGIDLRECRFSLALDQGIDRDKWAGREDIPVALGVWGARLIPIKDMGGPASVSSTPKEDR